KNGILYINNMCKLLIFAQQAYLQSCKRSEDELYEWKMDMMKTCTVVAASMASLNGFCGFDNTVILLYNHFLLSLFDEAKFLGVSPGDASLFSALFPAPKEITSKKKQKKNRSNVKVSIPKFNPITTFKDDIPVEDVVYYQSCPIHALTLRHLLALSARSLNFSQQQQMLAIITLLLQRALNFVKEGNDESNTDMKKPSAMYPAPALSLALPKLSNKYFAIYLEPNFDFSQ
ncbi:hypothetical protein RFI_24429, partial [Reticulomyxa filosa]